MVTGVTNPAHSSNTSAKASADNQSLSKDTSSKSLDEDWRLRRVSQMRCAPSECDKSPGRSRLRLQSSHSGKPVVTPFAALQGAKSAEIRIREPPSALPLCHRHSEMRCESSIGRPCQSLSGKAMIPTKLSLARRCALSHSPSKPQRNRQRGCTTCISLPDRPESHAKQREPLHRNSTGPSRPEGWSLGLPIAFHKVVV